MSELVVVEKAEKVFIAFAKSIESEYALEDTIKLKQSQKRKLERQIVKQLGIRDKDLRELRSQKTKMLRLEIDFNADIIKKLNQIREKVSSDESIKAIKTEISQLRKQLKKLHEENRITYFTEIKKLIP
jgi:hypothetical protein